MTLTHTVYVALIRHGRTDWNAQGRLQGRTDIPLNENGRLDALRAAQALATESWHALYTSPLKRAVATAEIIGETLRLEPVIRDCLIERSYGVLEGKVRSRRRRGRRPRRRPVPGMESETTLTARALECLSTLVREHPGERIIVVSHGGFINTFLSRISQGQVGRGITRLVNGGITRLKWDPESEWQITSLNESAHLTHPQGPTDP